MNTDHTITTKAAPPDTRAKRLDRTGEAAGDKPLDLQNVGLLRFTLAVLRREKDPTQYLADLSGFDNLEAAIAISVGREFGVLASEGSAVTVTQEGRSWVRRSLSKMFDPFTAAELARKEAGE